MSLNSDDIIVCVSVAVCVSCCVGVSECTECMSFPRRNKWRSEAESRGAEERSQFVTPRPPSPPPPLTVPTPCPHPILPYRHQRIQMSRSSSSMRMSRLGRLLPLLRLSPLTRQHTHKGTQRNKKRRNTNTRQCTPACKLTADTHWIGARMFLFSHPSRSPRCACSLCFPLCSPRCMQRGEMHTRVRWTGSESVRLLRGTQRDE